jgi:uncharacterized membrane protein YdjX (TVP38/TMEM64 family)
MSPVFTFATLATLALVVFLCNLAPIFAPPTWSVLVYFLITNDLSVPEVVIIGALAAGLGRFLLGHATRALRNYIPIKARKNLYDAGRVFEDNEKRKFGILALFVISPLPSAQLFEAAGLMYMNLLRLTLAFFSGRIVTYSIYATGANQLKSTDFGELLTHAFTSPYAWALQLFSIALIYVIAKIDWRKHLSTKNS